jgi:hypothetical protein
MIIVMTIMMRMMIMKAKSKAKGKRGSPGQEEKREGNVFL